MSDKTESKLTPAERLAELHRLFEAGELVFN